MLTFVLQKLTVPIIVGTKLLVSRIVKTINVVVLSLQYQTSVS